MDNKETTTLSTAKKWRIIALFCFALGVVLFIVGWLMGSNFMLYVDSTGVRFANEHTASISSGLEFNSLNISSNIANIELNVVDGPFSTDLFTHFNNVELVYYVERGTLFINVEKRSSFIFRAGFTPLESKVTVNIPSSIALNRVTINNTNDDTQLNGITADELFINSSNGNISLTNTQAEIAQIIIVDGDATLYNAIFELIEFEIENGIAEFENNKFDVLTASSRFGSFYFENCHAEHFYVNTRYGNITAQSLTTNRMETISVFGDISLSGNFFGRTNISNNRGNTTVYVDEHETEFSFNFITLGYVFINSYQADRTMVTNNTPHHLRISSHSGNINVNFATQHIN